MKLLVDVGNSCVKWAYLDNGALIRHGTITHDGYKLDDVLGSAWRGLPKPSAMLVANVAGPMASHVINHLSDEYFGLTPTYAVSGSQLGGVTSGYHDPTRLGVDRWASLVGVFNKHTTPACIIDCGTAITLDALTAEGKHLGGLIAPGMSLMRHALVGATAAISDDEDEKETRVLAKDTRSAVASGAFNAAMGLIERVSGEMIADLGVGTQRYITGGDAECLLPHLGEQYTFIPHLVLEGLAVMSEAKA